MKSAPEGDDNELRVFGAVFDVVRDDGDVAEIQRRIDLIHEVQRCGLHRVYRIGR